ncbi:MAG: acetylesterase [Candidatus Raymondbacteria bacterium RifOxyA12_full_50_37]|uniref:Acetylesterase n=1 Tax=Candidatus Raymondbacteria bacterium RIFOXYD12_FULL_49_13 TaxID=1817890 RepID=A0A1F7F2I7_UNCRA|nr:MAG: acetylesterase [Candidatus Raymondbacteria bacterium RifOxyA12_full_50_37]OGJ85913.1 MAG: acetylesterase [Candidatus Raymondbacteria bacterium RIFOXYA2_FULL_49_16]OGJ95907.1 MAG: acetylesterase [Candidatus Raymondbacteria bacterium RIFOXYC2_FULL_50_21]OGJ99576.1 MAG: acetylesterase [Candidatus Raymondbacteria bacterium RifOxyC12_full_50_8]OGK00772.1 MAG: acetylesterase [Candidatus Raymondbacteria bacterium RIFOXYD12_FULL_49_13]OGP39759.1 MAG: acetylesterase [Candidatus Raymondbacteria 
MPLTFDFPLKKLKTYKGINPRPKDFDAFWNKGLSEMRAVNPRVELKKAAFEAPYADCYNMYFTGVGNARVHAKLLRPKTILKPGPAIVIFHGYSGSSGDWFDKLAWVAAGFTVVALDCRGQGGLSDDTGGVKGWTLRGHIVRGLGDKPENMTFRQIFLDAAQLAGLVMKMPGVDPKRVGAMGGSQGGGLTLACAALEPRIKKAAPAFPFLCDYQRVWEMDLAAAAYEELKDWFRRFDPTHEREKEVFTQLGYIDVQHLAARIKAEIMMAIGFMDKICPPSTQFAAYNKIRGKKSLVMYPDFGHEDLPGFDDRRFRFMRGL